MGFLDRLVGGGRGKEAPKEEAGASAAPTAPEAAPQQPELMPEPGGPSYGPPKLDIHGIAGAVPSGFTDMAGASGGGARLYDPYEGISTAVNVKKHAFRLPSQPEFVFEEEAAVKRRGWNENLQFYTGIGYLSGGITGVSAGLYNYATVKPDIPLTSLKLKANRLLNLAGTRAKPFSNTTAICGLFFSSFESYLSSQLELYDVPDAASTVLAGTLSGALFRSPRGPRQALAAGAVGAVVGAGIVGLRKIYPSL